MICTERYASCEEIVAVLPGVAVQVDGDVDSVFLNNVRGVVDVDTLKINVVVGRALDSVAIIILPFVQREAVDFEPCPVVLFNEANGQMCDGMVAKIAGKIANSPLCHFARGLKRSRTRAKYKNAGLPAIKVLNNTANGLCTKWEDRETSQALVHHTDNAVDFNDS